jgi:hypothetical protein
MAVSWHYPGLFVLKLILQKIDMRHGRKGKEKKNTVLS